MALIYCKECGKEISDTAASCPHCGYLNNSTQNENKNLEEENIVLNIFSFLLPIVGLVLYIIYLDTHPTRAKSIGKYALFGTLLPIIFIISAIFGFWISY